MRSNKNLRRRIADKLRKLGLEVKENYQIVGDSGITHNFDLKIRNKAGNVFVVEILEAKVIDENKILGFHMRLYDTNLTGSGIIISNEFTDEAKLLANACKIRLVTKKDVEEISKY